MVIWIIGLSGAGKTTLAKEVVAKICGSETNVVLIDGDMIREVFGNDLGHTLEDRRQNADRVCRLCRFLDDQGIHVVCAILSLFPESRLWNRDNIKNYYEVYIETPIEHLQKRDYKGLYRKFSEGEIKNVAGMDIEFIPPDSPDLSIKNNGSLDNLLTHANFLSNLLENSSP
jgi:adenylylsulfate kinase|tara:strand:- start:60 stop:575 length:516 start_codon:yes stop_codon:yes gene_type:complete